ncbi:MAG TPA: host attachment protein [Byssovorax sp.]|jgi:hypothetical protein
MLSVDASRARILELDTASHDWRGVASFDVDADTSSWLDADEAPRSSRRAIERHGAAAGGLDRAERELGRRVLQLLEREHAEGSFTRLLVVAPSAVLDRLLEDASPALRAAVSMQCRRTELDEYDFDLRAARGAAHLAERTIA